MLGRCAGPQTPHACADDLGRALCVGAVFEQCAHHEDAGSEARQQGGVEVPNVGIFLAKLV
ncbi:MAG: hypothetical protein ACRDL8_22360, partial [Solirubrobacteraceae bacterium]